MPRGLNRSGNFSKGTPITLPHEFGTPITEPKNFGNPVTWEPNPAHFGNQIGSPEIGFLLQANGSYILLASGGNVVLV